MPHFISQLLELLSQASPENFFISIYESGDDQTAKWLELLQELLEKLDVPSLIVTNGLSREDGQDRIAFLADMRNRALAPLFGSDGFWSAKSGWPADKVIFINDVFFCAGDILRLLAHPGDVVCGMDFAHFMYDPDEMYPAGKLRPFGPYGPHLSDGQAGNDEHFTFYDMWVARDANGQPFSNYRPYVSHLYSLERIQKGLPFPVTCCWNGLVVLDAEPFRQGIRFRAHDPDECSASEVSLMCEDFQRAGHGQMIVDPGVRQAYTVEDAAELYGERVGFIPPTTFKEMKAAPPISYEYVPQKTHIMCCDKFEDGDHADWENCHPVDIYKLKSQVKYVKQGHSHHSHVPTSSSSRRRG
ncbi:hypothetical protein WJX72_011849 [[Myrmecia] bisecta]|uniref:Uncharacterized protein n=1 Tax=[Myrmecia] bisecta TaxID=41462 RepID=A0AAW1PHJ0_9CHLO